MYPHQLPNTPPESWLYHRPDLECIVSHDCILGWSSIGSSINVNVNGEGCGHGGLASHVNAINDDRKGRGLNPIIAMQVSPWPSAAAATSPTNVLTKQSNVYYLEDEVSPSSLQDKLLNNDNDAEYDEDMVFLEDENAFLEDPTIISKSNLSFLGTTSMKIQDELLFNNVAVGGTFDGLHYGHRKLLTLAISSVEPTNGKLLIGITSDDMLTSKKLSEYIPSLDDRIYNVKQFLNALSPGLKNRINIVVLNDPFGPPAHQDNIDALVLSHETLENGILLNDIRKKKGLKELKLLCTRRTEGNVMSSTMLRQWRKDKS